MLKHGAGAARTVALAAALFAGAAARGVTEAPPDAAEPAWSPFAAGVMNESCATRQLTLRWPVRVRPMTEYGGGYTAGVGNIAWHPGHAETWRTGWCAIGVYCAPRAGPSATAGRAFNAPRGLYSHPRATLYVREPAVDAQTRATVAHETVHALQYQNFPALHAAHLWFNRDLSAAVDAAAEGDAHLVGWSFDPERRRHLCSVDPAKIEQVHRDWWGWTPHAVTALEGFPHVFGPGLVLRRLLATGTSGVNTLLRDPPLSSLAVLRPHRRVVDFVALPPQLARRVAVKDCQPGLTNTVGVVGIWGLLAQHEGADTADTVGTVGTVGTAKALPEFLSEWAGDRFVHVVCDGEANDELAWLTRWRSAAAAAEFARRFTAVARAAAKHGSVLGEPARAVAQASWALVATPGLASAADAIFRAPVRTYERYADWFAGGCFPHGCHSEAEVAAEARRPSAEFACSTAAAAPQAFENWLERMRQARAGARQLQAEGLAAALTEAGRLAVFCARNAARNSDLLAACRAGNYGLRHLATAAQDAHWHLLPLCASEAGYLAQMRPVLADAQDGSAPQAELRLRAAGRAAAALRTGGTRVVRELAATPPLSTLELLDADFAGAVEFLRLAPEALAARGCEVLASDVVGAAGLWTRLRAFGLTAKADEPPPLVRAWRGDRQWLLRCGARSGWIWASRWTDAATAARFVREHLSAAGADPDAPVATVTHAEVAGRTAWSWPAALAGVKPLAQASLESRSFGGFGEWRAAGCYPQPACR